MKKFEYLKRERNIMHNSITQNELNDLGSDGWELVTIIPQNNNGWITYFFKREIIQWKLLGCINGIKEKDIMIVLKTWMILMFG